MNTQNLNQTPVLVVGAGIMGAGIVQIAAQAGHPVMLFDTRENAAAQAREQLATTFDKLVNKGKLSAEAASAALQRIQPINALEQAANAGLVVEAILENLEIKRGLFQQLEGIVSPECILATNTSSISVTAIANGLQRPQRLVGMHFFNPVPLMKLVEVVTGLQTDKTVAETTFVLSKSWGKTPVYAKSTPGFIVNRIARPYYAETLALLQEQAATPAVLDACLRAAGFRMGPCELMDLIGHDTNFSVTRSVYEANFYDKRFVPSLVQKELVDGGLLGRKSGQGFYDYRDGAVKPELPPHTPVGLPEIPAITLCGTGRVAELLAERLQHSGAAYRQETASPWVGLRLGNAALRLSDGRTASQLGGNVAVFDLPISKQSGATLAWAASKHSDAAWQTQVAQCLQALGFSPLQMADTPGLVVARTIAMLINEAADAVQQGVCTPEGADAAMKLGVNYPAGPFEWLADWDANAVINLLEALDEHYRGERYRVSPYLRASRVVQEEAA